MSEAMRLSACGVKTALEFRASPNPAQTLPRIFTCPSNRHFENLFRLTFAKGNNLTTSTILHRPLNEISQNRHNV